MKKILIVSSVASMIDQFIMPNIELLKDHNVEVHVAANFEKGNTCSVEKIEKLKTKLELLDVTFYQINFDRNVFDLKNNMLAILQLMNITKSTKFDYIHSHSPIGGVCARIVGQLRKIKVIYTAHGFHFFKGAPIKNWLIYYPIEKILSNFTDTLITINLEDYTFARKKFPSDNIKYLPGVGIQTGIHFNSNRSMKSDIRKELCIPTESKVMLSVGELNQNKNHDFIIDSMCSSLSEDNVYYIICGQGEMYSYYINKIKDLKLEKKVFFLGFREDVKDIYKMADLFVFPSKREGLPVSIMEAMNNKLPVVCSNIRGNTDLIDENKGGIYIDLSNMGETSHKINDLLQDENSLDYFGEYNAKKIKKFDVKNINKMLLDIYGIKEADLVSKIENM